MKKSASLGAIVIAAALLAPLDSRADKPPAGSEADKGRQIAAVLQQSPPHLHRIWQPAPPAPCEDLLKALGEASPEVQFIEPSLRADDFSHPDLARYQRCNEKEGTGIVQSAQHRFRLYRVEMDGDESNGLEEYLYAEWKDLAAWKERAEPGRNPKEPPYYAGYHSIDLACSRRDGVSVNPEAWGSTPQYNAIVRFRSTFHLLNMILHPGSKPDYYFTIRTFEPKQRAFGQNHSCLARTFRQKPIYLVPHY